MLKISIIQQKADMPENVLCKKQRQNKSVYKVLVYQQIGKEKTKQHCNNNTESLEKKALSKYRELFNGEEDKKTEYIGKQYKNMLKTINKN